MEEKKEETPTEITETEIKPEPIEKLQKKKYKYPYDAEKNKEYKQRSKQKKLIETRVDELVNKKLKSMKPKIEKKEAPTPVKENIEAPKIETNQMVIPQEYITKEKYKKLKNKINNLENKFESMPLPQQIPVKVNPVYGYLFR